jgi:hypothetical protein
MARRSARCDALTSTPDADGSSPHPPPSSSPGTRGAPARRRRSGCALVLACDFFDDIGDIGDIGDRFGSHVGIRAIGGDGAARVRPAAKGPAYGPAPVGCGSGGSGRPLERTDRPRSALVRALRPPVRRNVAGSRIPGSGERSTGSAGRGGVRRSTPRMRGRRRHVGRPMTKPACAHAPPDTVRAGRPRERPSWPLPGTRHRADAEITAPPPRR